MVAVQAAAADAPAPLMPATASPPGAALASARRRLVVILAVIAVLFLVLGVFYLADPGALPLVFFRPHEAIRSPHPIRGGVALGLGALAAAGTWLASRSKLSVAGASGRRLLVVILAVIGLASLVLGLFYLADPGVLPLVFFSPHEATRGPHLIRAGLTIGVSAVALTGTWLASQSRRS
jgi:uncharacterized membrane protein